MGGMAFQGFPSLGSLGHCNNDYSSIVILGFRVYIGFSSRHTREIGFRVLVASTPGKGRSSHCQAFCVGQELRELGSEKHPHLASTRDLYDDLTLRLPQGVTV